MELKIYQEYNGLAKERKLKRRLILIEEGKRAFYVNGSVVEPLWLSTAETCLPVCKEITREEALCEVPELADFLDQVLPTLSPHFGFHPLSPSQSRQPGEAP